MPAGGGAAAAAHMEIGHLANIVWSYQKLRVEGSPSFYAAVERNVIGRMKEANELDLANLAFGFSSCRTSSTDLFQVIAEEVGAMISFIYIYIYIYIYTPYLPPFHLFSIIYICICSIYSI